MLLRTADCWVIAAAATLVATLALLLWTPGAAGSHAEVRGPTGVQTVALADEAEISVAGLRGVSVLEVRAGRVRFADGPCRGRVCVAAGWLGSTHDFAACAPNGVSVRIRDPGPGYDGINY